MRRVLAPRPRLIVSCGTKAGAARSGAGAKGAAAPGQSKQLEIPIRKVVPGDLVVLAAGDMIPADCRVLVARDLFVAQAAMTGESLPVEKFADRHGDSGEPLEQSNLAFMGTNNES